MIDVRWMWLFLDTPRADAERSWDFWAEVTGWHRSPTRGEHGRVRHAPPTPG